MVSKRKELVDALSKLSSWLEINGYSSYDSYDFWSTKIGIFSRYHFYKNRFAGLPLVSLIQAVDTFFPQLRSFFGTRDISAEAMPYFALGYLRLYKLKNDIGYLRKAEECLNWLIDNATQTPSGLGWGLHFDWPSRVLIKRRTPCVTITAYSTEALLTAYRITGQKKWLNFARETAKFVYYDLKRKRTATDFTAVSYTPLGYMFVVNANSYAARILYDIDEFDDDINYKKLASKIVQYVLSQQEENGLWAYWDRGNNDNFADSIHTAFILENLYSIYLRDKSNALRDSLIKGFSFLRSNFIRDDYSCKYYYNRKMPSGIKVDIRSCAEIIYCCALLSDLFPEALKIAEKVALWTVRNMQDKEGFFYFRKYITHTSRIAYMRWAQAPMFNALTFLEQITDRIEKRQRL